MALRAVSSLAGRKSMDVGNTRHHRQVTGFVAIGAIGRRRDRHVALREGQSGEVLERASMAADAIARGRVRGILHHELPCGSAGAGLEAHILRGLATGHGARHKRVLRHRHPSIATLMAILAAGRHTRMDLRSRWRRHQEQGAGDHARRIGRHRRFGRARLVARSAIGTDGNMRRGVACRRRWGQHNDVLHTNKRRHTRTMARGAASSE